jgi:outer membrane protein assembly factor BamB
MGSQSLIHPTFIPPYRNMSMRPLSLGLTICLAFTTTLSWVSRSGLAAAQDWPGFHGPGGLGNASGALPDGWTDSDYLWKVNLGGTDVGSVAIAGNRTFLLTFDASRHSLALVALDLGSGKEQWRRLLPIGEYHLHKRNTYASSTPTVDGDSVYVAYADADHTWLRSFSVEGQERWARDFGPWQSDHGFATSPRVAGGLVVLYDSQQAEQLEPGQLPSHERMIAVDAATGADKWETELKPTRTNYSVPGYYSTPAGVAQVIGSGTGNGVFGIDAKSGKKLWELPVIDKRSVGSPLIIGDLALASCGSGGGGNVVVAVKIPASAEDMPKEVYRIERSASYVPTPAVDGDHLMMVSDNGILSRVRLNDGGIVWSNRLGGNFGASPIVIGNKTLVVSLDGIATIVANADRFEKLGEVDLGAGVGASPAAGGGKLLIRVGEELRCLSIAKSL